MAAGLSALKQVQNKIGHIVGMDTVMTKTQNSLIIFGAGLAGELALEALPQNYKVLCFVDNDKSKHGQRLKDISILSPEIMLTQAFDLVLVASMYYEEITLQLHKMGIPADKVHALNEQTILDQAQRKIDKDPSIAQYANRISDDTIIHFKGEKPELVNIVPTETGLPPKLEPRRGSILTKKVMYSGFVNFTENLVGEEQLEQMSVLDVGATHSLLFELMNKTGTGVNVADGAVKQMQDQGIEAKLASGDTLPFDDNSFDVVLCFNTLCHMDNPIGAMREMRRVGRKYLVVGNGDCQEFRFLDYSSPEGDHRSAKFRWPSPEFHRLADYTGMKIISEQAFHVLDEPETAFERVFQKILGNKMVYRLFGLDLQK